MNQTAIGSYIAKKRRPQNLTQEQLSVAEILAGVWIIEKQVLPAPLYAKRASAETHPGIDRGSSFIFRHRSKGRNRHIFPI